MRCSRSYQTLVQSWCFMSCSNSQGPIWGGGGGGTGSLGILSPGGVGPAHTRRWPPVIRCHKLAEPTKGHPRALYASSEGCKAKYLLTREGWGGGLCLSLLEINMYRFSEVVDLVCKNSCFCLYYKFYIVYSIFFQTCRVLTGTTRRPWPRPCSTWIMRFSMKVSSY